MIYYHLQHYFALDHQWRDIPHVNGGCSSSKEYIYEVYDHLLNLPFIRFGEYRIILSGTDSRLPLDISSVPLFTQLSLF